MVFGKARVIRILDEYRLVINVGSNDRIDPNYFVEIEGKEDKVYDPYTKKVLGEIKGPKARLSVGKVEEQYTVCESTFLTMGDQARSLIDSLARLPETKYHSRLNVDLTEVSPFSNEEEIKVGDVAIYAVLAEDAE